MLDKLPDARSLHVLMIGLGDEVLTGWGDTRERHLEYAERIAHLHLVGYSPRSRNLQTTSLSEHLTIYPTRSATRPHFLWDAYRIGAQIIRQHPIDLITTQDPFATGLPGLWLKQRFGIPLDLQNHSDFFDNRHWIAEKPLRNGFFNWLGKHVIKRGNTHRVLNKVEKAKYVALGIPPERVVVLSTPVRLERFQPEAPPGEQHWLREQLNIPINAPVLLWVGRPVWFKRVPVLIEAFTRAHTHHPDIHLVLVSEFNAYPEATELIRRYGLQDAVHFAGKADHSQLPAYYRLCTAYIHTSIYEGLGKVMIEAASCGKPVISTRTAGAQEIVIDGETGLLCEPENPADLAEKITALIAHPDRAQKMGAAGRAAVAEKFDHTRNLDAVVETWQRTVAFARGDN
jgi:glycosyltransferase involved in cell wall biosynthesis